jgi:hypothetical protein
LVIPAIVRVPAVLLASAQVPPLLASVMVATVPEAVSVAEQFENPLGRVIVAPEGTVKLELNVTVMVLPEFKKPLPDGVKPTVQVEVAWAVWGAPEKVTDDGLLAEATPTSKRGDTTAPTMIAGNRIRNALPTTAMFLTFIVSGPFVAPPARPTSKSRRLPSW